MTILSLTFFLSLFCLRSSPPSLFPLSLISLSKHTAQQNPYHPLYADLHRRLKILRRNALNYLSREILSLQKPQG
ncbi:hypothetical protein ACJW31_10G092000 [Castanea mollissima]